MEKQFYQKAQPTAVTALDWKSEQEIEKGWVRVINTTLHNFFGRRKMKELQEEGVRRCEIILDAGEGNSNLFLSLLSK